MQRTEVAPAIEAAQHWATASSERERSHVMVLADVLQGRAEQALDGAQMHVARWGVIAAQVLKGAKAAEVPFEQATELELVVNLKAARRLSIAVPHAVRIAADTVIE